MNYFYLVLGALIRAWDEKPSDFAHNLGIWVNEYPELKKIRWELSLWALCLGWEIRAWITPDYTTHVELTTPKGETKMFKNPHPYDVLQFMEEWDEGYATKISTRQSIALEVFTDPANKADLKWKDAWGIEDLHRTVYYGIPKKEMDRSWKRFRDTQHK